MFRVVIAMIIASAATAGGQILIRRGMQDIGSLEELRTAGSRVLFLWGVDESLCHRGDHSERSLLFPSHRIPLLGRCHGGVALYGP